MTTLNELTANELADLANRYTKISTFLFEYRITHKLKRDEEQLIRVEGEHRLDTLANLLRGEAIRLMVEDATLKQLDDVRAMIGVVTDLVGLGGAVLSGNAKAIVTALKAFKKKDGAPA